MGLRAHIARFLAPEEFLELEEKKANADMLVNQRVADIVFQMNPFEPFMKKYLVAFPSEWENARPEDTLDSQGAMRLFMWAYGTKADPNFIYLTDWLRDQQGNNTLRKGKNDHEWFFGRAAIVTITLFIEEVGRLSSKYAEVMAGRDRSFDENLPVGEY